VDRDGVLFVVLPIMVALGLLAGFLLVWRRDERGGRPWWGSPLLWLSLAIGFVILGVLVWPWLLGGRSCSSRSCGCLGRGNRPRSIPGRTGTRGPTGLTHDPGQGDGLQ
jgi:hypothetical protein